MPTWINSTTKSIFTVPVLLDSVTKPFPKCFGAFVIWGSKAAAETMEKWDLIVMEKCGSAVQSVDELTVDQR